MTGRTAAKRTAAARVMHDAYLRKVARSSEPGSSREFRAGETVRSLRLIKNDGIYPRKDIGEVLVQSGDSGIIRESWCFLGEVYYTVEFGARSVFVILRGREMVRIGGDTEPSIV